MNDRAFTVAELIAELSQYKPNARVKIIDADTYWTIPIFTVRFEELPNEDVVWIEPCSYEDMK